MKLRAILSPAVVAAVLAIPALPAQAVEAAAPSETVAGLYHAFGTGGRPLLSHLHLRRGRCPSGSAVTPRSDAWRCFGGNFVYDPCFSSPFHRRYVLCPSAPWRSDGVKLMLTSPLERRRAGRRTPSTSLEPWALELVSGQRCILSSGATSLVEGKRLNYFCGAHVNEGLWGLPERTTQPWTILLAPFQAKTLQVRAAIARAWM